MACFLDWTSEWVQEAMEMKGSLSSLLLVTLILHNPLDQHSHNALLQPVSCRHKPTNNLSDTTDSKLTKDADQGSLGWQNNCCTSYWKHTFNCIYYIGCWNDIINDQANSQLIVMIIPQRSLGWFADSGKTGIRSTHSGTCHSCSKAILSRTQLSQGEPLF